MHKYTPMWHFYSLIVVVVSITVSIGIGIDISSGAQAEPHTCPIHAFLCHGHLDKRCGSPAPMYGRLDRTNRTTWGPSRST